MTVLWQKFTQLINSTLPYSRQAPGRSKFKEWSRAKPQRRSSMPWLFILAVLLAFSSLLSMANVVGAQDSTPSPTEAPVDTPVPPTDTPLPPTDTPLPPTDTPTVAPPTDTPLPPTDTPGLEPPTDTPLPPTDTPTVAPPTDTPLSAETVAPTETITPTATLAPTATPSLSTFARIDAQADSSGGLIDAFTFYIPYRADILDDQFEFTLSDPPPDRPPPLFDVDIVFIISIAVDREGSIIYYDHWEDGPELNLTTPTQPSTEIWGDNNPANGLPPGFSTDLLATSATSQDDVITLRNTVRSANRPPDDFKFDGGDRLTSVGGAIAVTLTFWTAPPGPGTLYMDAWELYPTNRWGTDYRIPVGENLAGTGPNQRPGFEVVGLNVQAVLDNTTVNLDLNADGTFEETVTLNKGQQLTRLGSEMGIGPQSVLVGAEVQASAPVQVHLITANPQSRYEMRGYTMVPANQWTDDYLAPRSSDGDFWLYNPNDSELEIKVETALTASTTITIPANSTVKYPPVGLSTATGVRFTSTDERHFTALAALDESDTQDWGYSLLPSNRLATQALVGLGLGNVNQPSDADESRIYITALDDTTIFVDYDNDGNADANFSVAPLAEVAITAPNHDMTGAFLFTSDGTPFAIVWGQDESAPDALPSIDAGSSIVPLPSVLIQKTFQLNEDADCTGTVTVNDTVEFKLQYFNQTVIPIHNIIVSDVLPAAVTYVPHTTLLNGNPLPDNSNSSPFPLDEGGYNTGELPALGQGFLTFQVIVNDETLPIINQARISSEDLPSGSSSIIIFTSTQAQAPLYQIAQSLVDPPDGFAVSGQVITFNLAITNTGSETITKFPLQDNFDTVQLTFQKASPAVDLVTPGQLSWNDLTDIGGDLLPAATTNLLISFVVNQLPATVTEIVLQAIGVGGELSDGTILPACSARATVNLKPEPPPPKPTPPKPPDRSTQTPSPPPSTATPVVTTTVFPVVFLPETGTGEFKYEEWAFISKFLLLVLVSSLAVMHFLGKDDT